MSPSARWVATTTFRGPPSDVLSVVIEPLLTRKERLPSIHHTHRPKCPRGVSADLRGPLRIFAESQTLNWNMSGENSALPKSRGIALAPMSTTYQHSHSQSTSYWPLRIDEWQAQSCPSRGGRYRKTSWITSFLTTRSGFRCPPPPPLPSWNCSAAAAGRSFQWKRRCCWSSTCFSAVHAASHINGPRCSGGEKRSTGHTAHRTEVDSWWTAN